MARLRRFLPEQVADLIVAAGNGDALLQSHRREVTVVFCDLRGFTAFAETAEPEEVMAVLGEYHSCLGEQIVRHGGNFGAVRGRRHRRGLQRSAGLRRPHREGRLDGRGDA